MSESLIERVAARMYDWEAEINDVPQRWKNVPPKARVEWHEMARAVLTVMREPTEAMVDAATAGDEVGPYGGSGPWSYWQRMIDEALRQSTGGRVNE